MPDESTLMPTSQIARWLAIGALILGAVALYFREGGRVPPLGPAPAAVDTAPAR